MYEILEDLEEMIINSNKNKMVASALIRNYFFLTSYDPQFKHLKDRRLFIRFIKSKYR